MVILLQEDTLEMGLHYCHLLDPDGTRLTYRHFAGHCSRVRQPPTLDVFFNRPILMEKNRAYKICLLLNRHGSSYSLGNFLFKSIILVWNDFIYIFQELPLVVTFSMEFAFNSDHLPSEMELSVALSSISSRIIVT